MMFQVGESRPKKKRIASEAIMFVEDVDHSHTFISWKDDHNRRWVAEAKGSGIRVISNVTFKEKSEVVNVYDYECTEEGYQNLIDFVWETSGDKYGFMQIYGLLEMRVINKLSRMFNLGYKHTNRFTDGEYSQICCEFILRGIMAGTGLVLFYEKIEQWGLRETRNYNLSHGQKADKLRLDRINGVV